MSAQHILATNADFSKDSKALPPLVRLRRERRPAMIRDVRESPTFYSRSAYIRL
jgi:hypothetical protein